jgi:TolB-like protein/Tfp pilus assembly protein PilF
MPAGDLRGEPEAAERLTVAILPFRNLSSDPENEYFTDGITEELISALSAIDRLKVISRTSAMQYKASSKGVIEIAKELTADSLVEGSVRKSLNRVRISVQLIDGRDEGHLWAATYDKELDDIFAVQSEIAEKVVEGLKVKLLESERRNLRKSPTSSSEAYTLYLKGRYHWNLGSKENLNEAMKFFELSVQEDPRFALGYVGLAQTHSLMAVYGYLHAEIAFPKAKGLAMKALEIDATIGEAHVVLGIIANTFEHDSSRAEEEFKKAISLNPSYPTAHMLYSTVLREQGRFKESHVEILKALELDPLSPLIDLTFGISLYFQRMYDKAVQKFERALRLNPNYAGAYRWLTRAYVSSSSYDKAMKAIEDSYRLDHQPLLEKLQTAYVYAAMGKGKESHGLLTEIEERFHDEILSEYLVARTYLMLNDKDAAFMWLERGYSNYDPALVYMGIDMELEPVRSDPRYVALLDKMGLGPKVVDHENTQDAAEESRANRLVSNLLKSNYRRVEDKLPIVLGETVSFGLITYNEDRSEYIVCDYCEQATKVTVEGLLEKLKQLARSNFDYKVRMGLLLSERDPPSQVKEYAEKLSGSKHPLRVISDPDEVNARVP